MSAHPEGHSAENVSVPDLAKRLAEALIEVLGGYASQAEIEIPVDPFDRGRVAVVLVRLSA